MDYADKVVAITGGAQGIGLAMARAFHQRGGKIAIADLQGAEATAEAFSGLGMTVDVRVEDEVAGFVRETGARLGPVDVYVSNAGVLLTDEPNWDAAGTDDGVWQTAFEINLMGAVRGARHSWPVMRERGGGVFVVVASAENIHLLSYSFIHPSIHSFIHSFIYSSILLFIHSFIHPFIYCGLTWPGTDYLDST